MSTLWRISGWLIFTLTLASASRNKCKPSDQFECVGFGAFCDDDETCKCIDNNPGNPFFHCFLDKSAICNIFSDPRGKTFGREPVGGIDIPMPCKYLLTHVCTENHPFSCNFQIFAGQERGRGKFFISTFEVILQWSEFDTAAGQFSFRVEVNRTDGELNFYKLRTRESNSGPYGPDASIAALDAGLGGLNIFYFDDGTYSVFLYLERCGLDVNFRAADDLKDGKDQLYLPGLSIGVNEEDFNVQYKLLNETFCLTSDKDDITVGDVANMLDLKEDHAFIYRALVNGYPHDMPNMANSQCEALERTAKNCTDKPDRMKAFEECDFIWSTELFANCYSDYCDSRDLITLFDNCIQAYCHRDVALCLANQADVSTSGCGVYAPPEFTGFDCTML